jgi:hypothetical protein
MISKEQWEEMTPQQQKDACFKELADMLTEAAKGIYYIPFNEETRLYNGTTTLVTVRDDVLL